MRYAIWKDKKVIGYIDLSEGQKEKLNGIPGIGVYFGFNEFTNPEMYNGQMRHVETVGNLKIYVSMVPYEITVSIYNGSDLVFSEMYATPSEECAISDAMQKLDYYTESYLRTMWMNPGNAVCKLSENTFCTPDRQDWFCRVDNTPYFLHYARKEEDFIRDKYGKRLIDR